MTANLVSKPLGFQMTRGWMQGDRATNDLHRAAEHFAERFEVLVSSISKLGFSSLDLWCAHLHPEWATARHLEIASATLKRHGMRVSAYLWYGGSSTEDLRVCARVMSALETDLISGSHGLLDSDRKSLVSELRNLRLRLAYENHPETSGAEILAKIGQGDEDVLGVAYDTGWAGTKGFDAAAELPRLLPRLFHFHAKDVKARRKEPTGYDLIDSGHETCTLGDGIVGIEKVLRAAVAGGFTGPIGIEHEPETHNPDEECRESLRRVRSWLA
ncbi:MAG: sugar phosphate isomerase/epimerase [Candidatus Methylacidiphilales bacterium]|nr:sugar phosphate isomerase/epimerase [Candidatus Methylacidiphilales bacterium]